MGAAGGGRFHDLQRPLEGLVVVAGHFSNDKGTLASSIIRPLIDICFMQDSVRKNNYVPIPVSAQAAVREIARTPGLLVVTIFQDVTTKIPFAGKSKFFS